MKYENLEFHEALKVLAEKAGVELKRAGFGDQREYDVLYEINEAAKDFFIKQLEQSKEGSDYLKERGLKKETIERFGLGFAGAAPDNLTVYLIKAGHNIKDIIRAGLAVHSERGLNFDRFRGRLMFPLFNHYGKTIGFTGRILERLLPSGMELAKYVNSPETPIFNKSRMLYGYHETKGDIRKKNEAVLIEGQMDFLMGWQEGARNVAAVSGTALSADHLKTLRRSADVLTFCFDNDEAGIKALERGTDLAVALDFHVKAADLGTFKDPADAVLNSPGFFLKQIENAKPAMENLFDRRLKSGFANVALMKNDLRFLLGKIKKIQSAVERAFWLSELSRRTAVSESALTEEMDGLAPDFFSPPKDGEAASEKSASVSSRGDQTGQGAVIAENGRWGLVAEQLFSLALAKKEFFGIINNNLDFFPEIYREVYAAVSGGGPSIGSGRTADAVNFLHLRAVWEAEKIPEERFQREMDELARQLKLEFYKERRRALSAEIKKAELSVGENELAALLKEFGDISEEIIKYE